MLYYITKHKRISVLLLNTLITALFIVLRPLAAFMIQHFPPCPFLAQGIICPSCGGTRCIENLVNFHFEKSFQYHPYIFLVACYCFVVWILLNLYCLLNLNICLKLLKSITGFKVFYTIICGYILFGILRSFL